MQQKKKTSKAIFKILIKPWLLLPYNALEISGKSSDNMVELITKIQQKWIFFFL